MNNDAEQIQAIQAMIDQSPDEDYQDTLEILRENELALTEDDEGCLFDIGCNCTPCKKDPRRFIEAGYGK